MLTSLKWMIWTPEQKLRPAGGGLSVTAWRCFAASGPDRRTTVESTVNHQRRLEEHVRPSDQSKTWRVLDWQSQSPDLHPTEMLQGDLKQAARGQTGVKLVDATGSRGLGVGVNSSC